MSTPIELYDDFYDDFEKNFFEKDLINL